jgi:hypothetical protein
MYTLGLNSDAGYAVLPLSLLGVTPKEKDRGGRPLAVRRHVCSRARRLWNTPLAPTPH